MATDQGVGGSNPLTHVEEILKIEYFQGLFYIIKDLEYGSGSDEYGCCSRKEDYKQIVTTIIFTDIIVSVMSDTEFIHLFYENQEVI